MAPDPLSDLVAQLPWIIPLVVAAIAIVLPPYISETLRRGTEARGRHLLQLREKCLQPIEIERKCIYCDLEVPRPEGLVGWPETQRVEIPQK